jgi:hypothetical protein
MDCEIYDNLVHSVVSGDIIIINGILKYKRE